ncbi:hypothetical protein PRIPAC_80658 [Pristionchus pacificus]|uniref:STAS domain-containing protein n=1 Tax=Pristionchus pacificus TaxID=54126 RepID=A0A2A6BI41_PRIPA|nr:hypothetical protein PRIPAC_80658 [Pristionchus pacificus]|eukprot:PDM65562.1 hypothetical protein PRIPAC_52504 [Pristionchus pacificus]
MTPEPPPPEPVPSTSSQSILSFDDIVNEKFQMQEILEDYDAAFNSEETALARQPMNQEQFDAKFAHKREESEVKRRFKKTGRRYIHPFTSLGALKRAMLGFFPIFTWLPKYPIKSAFLPDLFGGLTMGVMNVPQGIAYALLANVPPESGLYTAFLPPLIYLFFGTTRHNSIGCFSVVSLMCGLAVERFTDPTNPKYAETVASLDPDNLPTPEQVASSLTMLVSFINLAMALFRLDFLATYLSEQVVGAFTTAASIHVLVSQIPDIIGISITKHDGQNGYLVMNLWEIIKNIPKVNLYACGISVFCVVFLLLGKEVVSVQLKKRCNFPYTIPYELVLMIVTTACSYFFHLNEAPFNVKIVGNITTGLPIPAMPRFDLMPSMVPDAFTITECLALGITSVTSSFFPIYPVACSLSHSLLNIQMGTKTLLSNIWASAVVLATILFLAALLEPLPKPVLNCIIIVALMGIFNKFKELPKLWRVSKIDFSIWAISFLATVFIDIVPGLIISIFYALFTTIAREQWPRWHLLANVHGALDFADVLRYDDVYFFQSICMFRFDSPLLFTNVDRFKKCAAKALSEWERSREQLIVRTERVRDSVDTVIEDYVDEPSSHLVIDCSCVGFIDCMGVTAMKEVFVEMQRRGVRVYFANAKSAIRDLFGKCGYYDDVPKENFYPTIRDAVAIARLRQRLQGQKEGQFVPEVDQLSFTTIAL